GPDEGERGSDYLAHDGEQRGEDEPSVEPYGSYGRCGASSRCSGSVHATTLQHPQTGPAQRGQCLVGRAGDADNMATMLRPTWARLAAAFPLSPSTWVLRELSPDRTSARVAAVPAADAIRARLDEVVAPDGWSCQLLPLGDRALVCNLSVEGVTRSGVYELPAGTVPGSALGSASAIADGALAAAAAQFGMRLDSGDTWVDHEPETGEVLLDVLEQVAVERSDEPAGSVTAAQEQDVQSRAAPSAAAPAEERPEARQVIDRLVERLKAEGLGAAAARLVVEY